MNLEFYAVEFTEQDYILLYSSKHPLFDNSLSELSMIDAPLTTHGQHFTMELSAWLFDLAITLDPDLHSSLLGYLEDVVSHPFSFFQLYCKLLNGNKTQVLSEEESVNLMLMIAKLSIFIMNLDKNNIVPTIDTAGRWYESLIVCEFEKINDPRLSEKERKAVLQSSKKKFYECIRISKLMIKAFQRARDDADCRIDEIIHHVEEKNEVKYFYIENEPKVFAAALATLYRTLEFISYHGEEETHQKTFVECMRLKFRDKYNNFYNKDSLIVMFNQVLHQIKKTLTNKGVHLLLLNEVLSDLIELFV